MSLKKALHDAGICNDKIKRGQRDISTSKKGACLWCSDLQNTKQVVLENCCYPHIQKREKIEETVFVKEKMITR